MIKKNHIAIILILATNMTSIGLAVESPKAYKKPASSKTYSKSEHSINSARDYSGRSSGYRSRRPYMLDAKAIAKINEVNYQKIKQTKTVKPLSQNIDSQYYYKDLYLQGNQPKQPGNNKEIFLHNKGSQPKQSSQGVYFQEKIGQPNKKQDGEKLPLKSNKKKPAADNKNTEKIEGSQKNKKILEDDKKTIYRKKNLTENHISEKLTTHFTTFINKSLFTVFRNRLLVAADHIYFDSTFVEVLTELLLDSVFTIKPELKKIHDNNFDTFKMQIQYLTEQIIKYNNISIYTDINQMLLFMEFINQFVKENNIISLSKSMSITLDNALKTATECSYYIRNQNIILSAHNAPKDILSFFQPAIDTTNELANSHDYHKTMHTIYDTSGNMNTIMYKWNNFKTNNLRKSLVNRQYAAFITFLLLFENSIIATSIILDKSNTLYKTASSIPVTINIQ